jgi:hypothetical protein
MGIEVMEARGSPPNEGTRVCGGRENVDKRAFRRTAPRLEAIWKKESEFIGGVALNLVPHVPQPCFRTVAQLPQFTDVPE